MLWVKGATVKLVNYSLLVLWEWRIRAGHQRETLGRESGLGYIYTQTVGQVWRREASRLMVCGCEHPASITTPSGIYSYISGLQSSLLEAPTCPIPS